MVDRFGQRFPWFPAYLLAALILGILGGFGYLVFVEPVPYQEIYAYPTIHDGSVATKTGLHSLPMVAPGDLMYTYREYCLTKTIDRMYLRRWMEGTDDANREVLYAFELQLIVPKISTRGCHTVSLAIEAPAIKAGHYNLNSQLIVHTNVFRTDVVDLSPVGAYINGETPIQREARHEADLKKLQEFDSKVLSWMGRMEDRLTRMRGEIILYKGTSDKTDKK